MSVSSLVAAGALTVLAYAALCGYDLLGLAYVGRRLPWRRVVLASFCSYGVSHTLGFPAVTGGAVRYRLWRRWGLAPSEVARATAFVGLTFVVSLAAAAGAALAFSPAATFAGLGEAAHRLGLTVLGGLGAYVAWASGRVGPAFVRTAFVRTAFARLDVAPPTARLALSQIAVGLVDWTAAAAVLRVLLPAHYGPAHVGPAFLPFLGVFVVAHVAGLVSHVPGGLGVFEAVMVAFLRRWMPDAAILAALVAYRTVYYLVPFVAATAALLVYESRHVGRAFRRWTSAGWTTRVPVIVAAAARSLVPGALGATTFVAGAVLLFSGATPNVPGRAAALVGVVPLGFTEVSHLVGSMVGAMLLVLAWALARRLDAAWALTAALLGLGIGASLLKGFDWEEATLLAAVLGVVLPSRRFFYRKAALTTEPITRGWVAAVVAVVAASVCLGLLSYRHVDYTSDLWWRFAGRADASRFLRATAGAVGVLVALAVLRLRHAAAVTPLPDAAALDRAHAVVRRERGTTATLALLGDKALLFSPCGGGFIQYAVGGRSWVALGDPTGPPAVRRELAWRFRRDADREGGWAVFYEVSAENLPLYLELGLTPRKIGEEARVPLDTFSLAGGARRGLRRVVHEVERTGATFAVVPPAEVPALLPALRAVSDAWLAAKGTREKGFSLGRFDERYLARLPVAVLRSAAGEIVAFANVWSSETREELSVDLMRYADAAPRSAMEYLFVQIMLWGKANDYRSFNLGMAPLAGLEPGPLASSWDRLASLVYRHGEHFYGFRGLRAYKEKFDPVWVPKYLVAPGGLALPRVLMNVTTLISGGLPGIVGR